MKMSFIPTRPFVMLAALLVLGVLPLSVRAQNQPTGPRVAVERAGNDAHLVIQFERELPRNAEQPPTLNAIAGGDRVWWSAPLSLNGNRWRVPLDRPAIEGLLLAQRITVNLPATTADGRSAVIALPRDDVLTQLAEAASVIGPQPLFFTPPAPPPSPPGAPNENTSRGEMERYAIDAAKWNRDMLIYVPRFRGQILSAQSLWRDLQTAGRIPWSEAVVNAQNDKYQELQKQQEALEQERAATFSEAQRVITEWNRRNSAEPPINLAA